MDRLLRTSQTNRTAKNHPPNQVSGPEDAVINMVRVEPLSGYKIKLYFDDGKQRTVDFEPFLRNSRNPMIREYLNRKKFASFRLEYGDLVWDDYGLCFPIRDLYENQI